MKTFEVVWCLLVAWAVTGAFPSLVLGAEPSSKQDLAFLLEGVSSIAGPGDTGVLLVLGEQAFPLVCNAPLGSAEPVVAATRMGKGRAVAFADERFLGKDFLATPEGGKLISKAIRWSAGESAAAVRVGVLNQPELLTYLQANGFQAEALDVKAPLKNLKNFDAICFMPSSFAEGDIKTLARYVRGGGGILAAEKISYRGRRSRGMPRTEFAGNLLLKEAGIVWGRGSRDAAKGAGCLGNAPNMELSGLDKAIEYLRAHTSLEPKEDDRTNVEQASKTITRAVLTLPREDKRVLPRVKSLLESQKIDYADMKKHPITIQQPLLRLRLTLDTLEIMQLPAKRVKAHPAAKEFPGAIPADAPRVTRVVQIDTAHGAWYSTGLYAAPGEAIEVEMPAGVDSKGLSVRIGAHTQRLWNDDDDWYRMPEISRSIPLVGRRTSAANAFGGLIYIEAPPDCKLGTINVIIRHAVEAPYYVRGKTELAEWRNSIRNRPAPWAELEGNNVIMTISAAVVRNLDNPQEVMKFWDEILDEDADLAAIPRQRPYKERLCADTLTYGGGWMHSGYPIMAFDDGISAAMVDLAGLRKNGNWGLFHELGHNHQEYDWVLDSTWEVTENLFTIYNYEFSCEGPSKAPAWPPKAPEEMIKKYLATGPDYNKWKENPFLGLLTYYQLKEAFGWEAYKRVFAEYRALPDEQRPKTDDERRDQWMVRFSRAVGRNLGPFFQAWAIPTSEQARKSIADLPVWMPENFPPK